MNEKDICGRFKGRFQLYSFLLKMKEEQHAGSSANYDVEIIHPAEVHHETNWFCKLKLLDIVAQFLFRFFVHGIVGGYTSR